MSTRLLFCILATAACNMPTLRTLPQPVASARLDPLLSDARTAYTHNYPDKQLLAVYNTQADWTIERNERTGAVLGRHAETMFGYKKGTACTWELMWIVQPNTGGTEWGAVNVMNPQGANGDLYLYRPADCASISSTSTAPGAGT